MKPPGPQGFEVLKSIWSFQRNPLDALLHLTEQYGDIVRYRYGPFPVVLLNHPEAVQRILVDNHTNYGKRGSPFYKMLQHFLGEGLLTIDGDFWLRQRRLAQPAFQRKKIESFGPAIIRCTEEMIEQWRTLPPGTQIDADKEMMKLTLRIVGIILFSQDLEKVHGSVSRALDEFQAQMGERFSSLLPLPPVLPTARDRRFRQARAELHNLALDLVVRRRSDRDPPPDLLTSLIQSVDPDTGEAMDDQQICAELVTFMLAGTKPPPTLSPGRSIS